MSVRAYFGFAAPDNQPTPQHADTNQRQTRRLVATAAAGTTATAATLGLMWGTLTTPATAASLNDPADGRTYNAPVASYEGNRVNVTPVHGNGLFGAALYDGNGNKIGHLGEYDEAVFLGCGTNDPDTVLIQQYTSGRGGSGAYRGYAEMEEIRNLAGASKPIPCGG